MLDVICGRCLADGVAFVNASVARFAYIDFDASVVLPVGTALDSVSMEREMRVGVDTLGLPEGECNPFKDDVVVLLHTLQRFVRVSQFYSWHTIRLILILF